MDSLEYSAQLMNTLAQMRSQNITHSETEDALEENKRQFDTNTALQAKEFADNMTFMNTQHSEQMDFANRNLNASIDIANKNFDLQNEAYKTNLDLQNRQFNYQKELNQTQMEREDTAMQRYVKDLQSAGFSPLAAIGSSGSSSSPLSSAGSSNINPAQYDVAGINNAAGIYADFAKQYSALAYQARQDYSNHRSELAEKHNSDVLASRITLAKMRQDMRLGYANLANQVFNSAVNARNSKLQNEYLQEQKSYLEDKHKWEENNGYRGESWQTAAISALKQYLDSKSDKGTYVEKAFDVGKTTVQKAQDVIDENINKITDPVITALKSSGEGIANCFVATYYACCNAGKKVLSTLNGAEKKLYYEGEKVYRRIKGYKD